MIFMIGLAIGTVLAMFILCAIVTPPTQRDQDRVELLKKEWKI